MDATLGKFGPQDFDDRFRRVAGPAIMIGESLIPAGNAPCPDLGNAFDDLPGDVPERDC